MQIVGVVVGFAGGVGDGLDCFPVAFDFKDGPNHTQIDEFVVKEKAEEFVGTADLSDGEVDGFLAGGGSVLFYEVREVCELGFQDQGVGVVKFLGVEACIKTHDYINFFAFPCPAGIEQIVDHT